MLDNFVDQLNYDLIRARNIEDVSLRKKKNINTNFNLQYFQCFTFNFIKTYYKLQKY